MQWRATERWSLTTDHSVLVTRFSAGDLDRNQVTKNVEDSWRCLFLLIADTRKRHAGIVLRAPRVRIAEYHLCVLTTLFIATSLDGYIAGPDDDLSWQFTDNDYGFDEFYQSVDTLIMGRGTYDVVRGMGRWPYSGKRTLVVTRSEKLDITTADTAYFNGSLVELEKMLKEQGVKRSWLVGGGELVKGYLEGKLVEEVVVSVHPVLLGKGVPLFPGGFPQTSLKLLDAEAFDSGLVQLRYSVKS